jgi:hypothetical protein
MYLFFSARCVRGWLGVLAGFVVQFVEWMVS